MLKNVVLVNTYRVTNFCMRRSSFKRSLSDGNIICESNSPIENANLDKNENYNLPDKMQGGNRGLSESTPEILTCESDASYSRSAYIALPMLLISVPWGLVFLIK